MKIKKVFNNNVLLAEDDRQLEMILLGVGIAFQRKAGDDVDLSKVDKKFVMESDDTKQKFVELLRDVPINHLELTSKIIKCAETELNTTFNDSIYIGLTDHINYSLFRVKDGMALKNALMWEVKKFYPREFKAAMNALKTIEYYENVKLPEDEASFIALHFVNAQQDGEAMKLTIDATEIIQSILNIVKFHYCIELDETSLNYSRFVTHIRYFIRRFVNQEICGYEEDDFLFLQVKEKYPKAYDCSLKVRKYLETKFKMPITNDELLYFMLHINRVADRAQKR
ncbi:BglG family transcription antiterminator LicT [Turicibacter sanguinis]|uniref:BglG family transcription antiterminator LicT n=1 Tax=Turicibacter sanguinis TaxID=154288 RepID=UPI001B5670A9|nr:PRD domain-containing protein [Turicibacter sanguinis]MBP3908589.1 PRD domain-containing protein [Turicibacter sp.]